MAEFLYYDNRRIFDVSQESISLGVSLSMPKDIDGNSHIIMSLPWDHELHDLDSDGIPELFISYAVMNGEYGSYYIYKFDGDTYA